jgi:hypothetical protein
MPLVGPSAKIFTREQIAMTVSAKKIFFTRLNRFYSVRHIHDHAFKSMLTGRVRKAIITSCHGWQNFQSRGELSDIKRRATTNRPPL